MAMKPEHASADLALGMRYNTLVDCSGDIDPETLHPGIEEEEEEEDLEDPDADPDEDDRGDDVDPDLTEEEDDPDDEPGDSDKDDDDPDADPDAELDADALAELADGGKAKAVPHSRFNEINERLKARDADLERERNERLRLEEENARLKGATPKPEEQKLEKPATYDFDAAEDRYMDAMLDGDKDKAKEIRREIRAEEQKLFESKAGEDAKKAAEEELQKRDQATEAERLRAVLTEAIAKYPFLNNDSEEANQDAIEDVIARRDYYLRQGMSPSKAVAAAVEKIAPRYADAADELGGDKGQPVKEKPNLSKETIERNLDRQKKIPAVMPGVGERGKDVDYANLTEDEFDALPESEKRKARGDFVSERD